MSNMYHRELMEELRGALADAAAGNTIPADAQDSLRSRLNRELSAAQLLVANRVEIDPADVRPREQIALDLGLAVHAELEVEPVSAQAGGIQADQFAEPQ